MVHQVLMRNLATADAVDQYYKRARGSHYSFDEISHGVLAMYVIHGLLTTGKHAIEALITDAKCGTLASVYSFQAILLALPQIGKCESSKICGRRCGGEAPYKLLSVVEYHKLI